MLSDRAANVDDMRALKARLNAPFGARCFLTRRWYRFQGQERQDVLMHLLALGAF